MTTDMREATIAAFAARLATIPDFQHFRNLDRRLESEDYPAIVVWDGGEDIDREKSLSGLRVLNMRIAVEVFVRTPGSNVGPFINSAIAQVKAAIGVDPTLDGLAWDTFYDGADDPELSEEASGDVPRASILAGFTITRQEAEADPYAPQ